MIDRLGRGQYPQAMIAALEKVTPGQLTVFVPERTYYEKVRHQVMQVVMAMQMRVVINVVPTDFAPFQWMGIVRRVSAFDPSLLSFAAVRLQDLDDPQEVGRFFRRKLFGVLDVPDELIEYYVPHRVLFRSKKGLIFSEDSCPSLMDADYSILPPPSECSPGESLNALRYSSVVRDPEERLEQDLEDQRKQWIDTLSALMVEYMMRFNEAPPMELIRERIKGKFLLNSTRMSPITVSGDMKIYLPDLNEIQIRMTPLAATVYILFLCHPEGIRLKDIGDYADELAEIYSMVKPGASDRFARQSISELVNPMGNSLQEKLSMTRRAVRRYILDEAMAEHYLIKGERGEVYRISLPADMIRLPEILRR